MATSFYCDKRSENPNERRYYGVIFKCAGCGLMSRFAKEMTGAELQKALKQDHICVDCE